MPDIISGEHSGGKLGFLSKKVLGIPVSILLLVGVLVLAVVAWRMRQTGSGDTGTDAGVASDSSVGDAATDATDPDGDSYGAFAANPTPTYDPSNVAATTTVATNESWCRSGAAYAATALGISQDAAYAALQKYVGGDQLSYAQGKVRDAAVKQFGLPPEDFTSGGSSAKPVSTSVAKRQGTPPCTHTVRDSTDNTLTKLITLYYSGSSALAHANANGLYDLIQAANPSLAQGGPYPVGTKIKIPAMHDAKYYTSTARINTLAEIAAKNGASQHTITVLNDGMKFPVKSGTKVRVA